MASSSSCFGECSPVCKACRDNTQLWEPLALVELVVPKNLIKYIEFNEQQERVIHLVVPEQEDVIDPVTVADPQDSKNSLLTLRLHQFSSKLYFHYEKCTTRGLLVRAQRSAWFPHFNKEFNGTRAKRLVHAGAHITEPYASFTLADAKAFPEKWPVGKPSPRLLDKLSFLGFGHDGVVLQYCVEVCRRRLLPQNFSQAPRADRLSGAFCDVTISVEGQEFPAHRLVLAAASDVFRTMLTADFRERSEGRIEVKEVSAKAFAKFLDFLYSDGCPDWEDCELELLQLADQYQVARLKKLCEARVWQLSSKRAAEVLLQTSRKLLLTPALHERLCRQVAWGVATEELKDSAALLEALQTKAPYSAGMVDGIVRSGGPITPLTYSLTQQGHATTE